MSTLCLGGVKDGCDAYEVVKEPCTARPDERAPVALQGEPVWHTRFARNRQLSCGRALNLITCA